MDRLATAAGSPRPSVALFWLGVDALQKAFPGWQAYREIVSVSLAVSWIPAVFRLAFGPSI